MEPTRITDATSPADQAAHFSTAIADARERLDECRRWLQAAKDDAEPHSSAAALTDVVMAVHELTEVLDALSRSLLNGLAMVRRNEGAR